MPGQAVLDWLMALLGRIAGAFEFLSGGSSFNPNPSNIGLAIGGLTGLVLFTLMPGLFLKYVGHARVNQPWALVLLRFVLMWIFPILYCIVIAVFGKILFIE